MDDSTKTVCVDGEPVSLTPIEHSILHLLMRNPGKVYSTKALYEAVFDKLRAAGCTVVRVGTGLDEAHAPARRAYQKAGFTAKLESVTYYKKL